MASNIFQRFSNRLRRGTSEESEPAKQIVNAAQDLCDAHSKPLQPGMHTGMLAIVCTKDL